MVPDDDDPATTIILLFQLVLRRSKKTLIQRSPHVAPPASLGDGNPVAPGCDALQCNDHPVMPSADEPMTSHRCDPPRAMLFRGVVLVVE